MKAFVVLVLYKIKCVFDCSVTLKTEKCRHRCVYNSSHPKQQVLQQKFEDFMHELATNEDRVVRVEDMANGMLKSGHFEADKIRKRLAEIKQLWAELNEVARARQEVGEFIGPFFFFFFLQNHAKTFLLHFLRSIVMTPIAQGLDSTVTLKSKKKNASGESSSLNNIWVLYK
jgi:hypothetical protein